MTQATDSANLAFLQNAENLPSLPGVALEVLKLMREPDVDLESIAGVVGRDPALAARLLKLSNSSLFGYSREVTNLNQALMVLGLKTVKLAVISFSLVPALGGSGGQGPEQDPMFWRRSISAAVAGRRMCEELDSPLAEEASLCGLLMDIGVPVMVRALAEQYQPVVDGFDAGHPASCQAEMDAVGVTHPEVGAAVLRSWELPEMLIIPVAHHHDPESAEGEAETKLLTRIAAFTHEVASILASEERRGEAWVEAQRMGAEWFDMNETVLTRFVEKLDEDISQMADLMEVNIGGGMDASMILMQAQQDLLTETVQLDNKVKELETKATRDGLTGILNRAAFDETLARRWSQLSEGEISSLGVVMADVDKFKSLNDTFGHQSGDEVLQAVAKSLSEHCRGSDSVFRYGGEEFAVVLADVDVEALTAVAERLRGGLEAMTVETTTSGTLKVTASFGGFVTNSADGQAAAALKVADSNLYKAKETGRNRCVVT